MTYEEEDICMSYEDRCMSHTQCDAHKDMLRALNKHSIHPHEVGLFEGLIPEVPTSVSVRRDLV